MRLLALRVIVTGGKLTSVQIADHASLDVPMPGNSFARYNWRDTSQTSLSSLVDAYGNATLAGTSWTTESIPGVKQKTIDVSSGTMTIDGNALAGPQEFTFQLWVKLTAVPRGTIKIASRANSFSLEVTSNLRPIWKVMTPKIAAPQTYDTVTVDPGADNLLQLNTWHHLAGRWRSNGLQWVAELHLGQIMIARTTAPVHQIRDRFITSSICIGTCGAPTYSARIGLVELRQGPPCTLCGTDLNAAVDVITSCDWTSDMTINHVGVGGNFSGVEYFYATDSTGQRCIPSHPVVLVQGFGQYAESWSACHHHDITHAFTTNEAQSMGRELAVCDAIVPGVGPIAGFHLYTTSGNDWCPDDIVGLITSKGGDVITIDFDEAQRDLNAPASTFGWDRSWLWPGGTMDAPPASGTPRPFVSYDNLSKRLKGGEPLGIGLREFGRRGNILDNAYVLSLVIDYLYRSGGFSYTTGRKPTVVGHSMGGVIANWSMVGRSWGMHEDTWLGKDSWPQVHRVVTLGSPHKGSRMVRFGQTVSEADFEIVPTGYLGVFDDLVRDDAFYRPDALDFREELWQGLKVMAGIGGSWPGQADVHPDAWGPTTRRGAIDGRIATLINAGNTIPTHYEIAGLYNVIRTAPFNVCPIQPAEEVVRRERVADAELWPGITIGTVWQNRIVNSVTAWSGNFFPERSNADADYRACDEHDPATLISTECVDRPNWVPQCMGETNIAYSWRVLSQKDHFVEVVEELDKTADEGLGRGFAGTTGNADHVGFVFFLDNPSAFGFASGTENDALIVTDEALGLPNIGVMGGYAKEVRAPTNPACTMLGKPPTEAGPALNHHQLRTNALFRDFQLCNPELSGCTPVSLVDFIFQ